MTELITVEVAAVSGALDMNQGVGAGICAYSSGSDLWDSVKIDVYVALAD